MASTAKVKLNFGFADDTERSFELSGYSSDSAVINPATLKANIKALNVADFGEVYLSESGATCTGVVAANIYKVTETDINLNA